MCSWISLVFWIGWTQRQTQVVLPWNFHQGRSIVCEVLSSCCLVHTSPLPLKIFSSVWVCPIPANSVPFLHLVTHKTSVFSIDCVLVCRVRFLLPLLFWFFNLATPYGRLYMGQDLCTSLGLNHIFTFLPLLRGPILPVGRFFPLLLTSVSLTVALLELLVTEVLQVAMFALRWCYHSGALREMTCKPGQPVGRRFSPDSQ